MKKPDSVVIVGGGLAGMAAGLELLRRGKEVTLFEAGARPGGCCSTTTMDGYAFNDGAMYLALPELLDAAFGQLGMDRQALLPLRQIRALQRDGEGRHRPALLLVHAAAKGLARAAQAARNRCR